MTRKEIKQFYISLIDNPDAKWSKTSYNDWIYFTCHINNIIVECERGYNVKFIYIDKHGYSTTSETISFKDIGISKFRMLFPYFGLGERILRRIKREEANRPNHIQLTKSALSSVSEVISKDKTLNRDKKIDQILK